MIYRVGDNEISTYDHNSLRTAQTSEGQEKFDLNRYTKDKLSTDKEEGKEEKEEPGKKTAVKTGMTQRDGVKLELSGVKDRNAASGQDAAKTSESTSVSLLQTIQNVFAKVAETLKGIFDRIWNEPPQAEAEVEVDEPDISVPPKTDAQRNEEIQKYLHKGNLEQVISLLTDDGKRTIAKNSDLLTYYNKSGQISKLNASDSERILHGDRNVRKL